MKSAWLVHYVAHKYSVHIRIRITHVVITRKGDSTQTTYSGLKQKPKPE